jgi:hypothetical protein
MKAYPLPMETINGVTVYEEGEKPVLADGVPSIPKYIISKFGWILQEREETFCWLAATEADYRSSVGQMMGIEPDSVLLDDCEQIGDFSCIGGCDRDYYYCKLMGRDPHYFCRCSI